MVGVKRSMPSPRSGPAQVDRQGDLTAGRRPDVLARGRRTAAQFGGLAKWAADNGPASAEWTRTVLGWAPEEIGLLADIERPNYQG